MANNYAQGTFEPEIPHNLFTPSDLEIMDVLGLSVDKGPDGLAYLYNDGFCTAGYIKLEGGSEKEVCEDDLYAMLQEVIKRSNGELAYITHEQAYTCDRMRQGEFGGSAVIITADDVQYHGTSSWLQRRIAEVETGNFGPDTEEPDMPALPNLAEIEGGRPFSPVNLAIVLDGGLVQAVVSDNPSAFMGVKSVVIDYDTDSPDPDDECLGLVLQQDSSTVPAYMRGITIDQATIDLGQVDDFVSDKAIGNAQQRIAVCDGYPCEGSKDANTDGRRCVNETKCLAWTYYDDNN